MKQKVGPYRALEMGRGGSSPSVSGDPGPPTDQPATPGSWGHGSRVGGWRPGSRGWDSGADPPAALSQARGLQGGRKTPGAMQVPGKVVGTRQVVAPVTVQQIMDGGAGCR